MSIDIEQWVRDWRGPLTGWFVRRGARLADADERVADVFVRAWTARERFHNKASDQRAVGAWLMGIARNVEREAKRPSPIRLPQENDQPLSRLTVESPDETRLDGPAVRQLRTAIERLPPIERALIGAFYFDSTSTARVALLFGLSERAIEGRLRRARERLRAWLSNGQTATPGRR